MLRMEKNEKKTGILGMGLTFAGCYLGAGYVSGRELWQYFGSFGPKGFAGLFLSLSLLTFFTAISILAADRTGSDTLADLVVPETAKNAGLFKNLVDSVNSFLVAGIAVIMAAGINSMVRQLLGIPAAVTGLFAVLLIALASVSGVKGMVAVFSAAVPVLVVTAVVISSLNISETGFSGTLANIARSEGGGASFLSGGLVLSAMNYACLNNVSSVPSLAPLAKHLKTRKTVVAGCVLGALLLLLLAFVILLSLFNVPSSLSEDIPMLFIAARIHPALSYVYSLLMFLAMYGVAVSSMVAVLEFFKKRVPAYQKRRNLLLFLLFGLIYAGSLVGFSDLIAFLYPVYGYIGIGIMGIILVRFLRIRKSYTSP